MTNQIRNNDQHNGIGKIKNRYMVAATTSADVSIILGMPSKKCQFHGICRIEPDGYFSYQSHSIPWIKATIILNESQELVFHFDKKNLSRKMVEKHFSTTYFQVLESINIPPFLELALGQAANIKVGNYLITEQKTVYKVFFGKIFSK